MCRLFARRRLSRGPAWELRCRLHGGSTARWYCSMAWASMESVTQTPTWLEAVARLETVRRHCAGDRTGIGGERRGGDVRGYYCVFMTVEVSVKCGRIGRVRLAGAAFRSLGELCQLEATVEQLGDAVVGAGGVLPEAGETRGRAGY